METFILTFEETAHYQMSVSGCQCYLMMSVFMWNYCHLKYIACTLLQMAIFISRYQTAYVSRLSMHSSLADKNCLMKSARLVKCLIIISLGAD